MFVSSLYIFSFSSLLNFFKPTVAFVSTSNLEPSGYIAKSNGFVKPDEYAFDENKQYIFEGILYTALTLYNNGGASKSRLAESHKRFIQEIEQKNEEKLSRTQQLNTVKIQALRELGYSDINTNNASEVFEKIAEIQSRKV